MREVLRTVANHIVNLWATHFHTDDIHRTEQKLQLPNAKETSGNYILSVQASSYLPRPETGLGTRLTSLVISVHLNRRGKLSPVWLEPLDTLRNQDGQGENGNKGRSAKERHLPQGLITCNITSKQRGSKGNTTQCLNIYIQNLWDYKHSHLPVNGPACPVGGYPAGGGYPGPPAGGG